MKFDIIHFFSLSKKKILAILLLLTILLVVGCTVYRAYYLLFDYNQSGLWDAIKYGLVGGNRYKLPDDGPVAGLIAPLDIIVFILAPIGAAILAIPIKSWMPWPMKIAPIATPVLLVAAIYLYTRPISKQTRLFWVPIVAVWLIFAFFSMAAIMAVGSI